MPNTETPASFEELRKFIEQAADQLLTEMKMQQANYLVPAPNVLALMEQTAAVRGESVWDTWESWALRHAIPIHDIVKRGGYLDGMGGWILERDRVVMEKRLRDVLGYVVLALVMCAKEKP